MTYQYEIWSVINHVRWDVRLFFGNLNDKNWESFNRLSSIKDSRELKLMKDWAEN